MSAEENLRRDIRNGRTILLVGSGVSRASTDDEKSTWAGLLCSGLSYAIENRLMEQEMADICHEMLTSGSAGDYLEVASELASSLGGKDGAHFGAWLNEDVGALTIHDSRVLDAILALGAPVITTNYDDLLERAGNRDHVTWLQGAQFQQVIAGGSNAIGHFHGYYTEPRSVVLSRESYELLLSDQLITALKTSMSAISNIIYVGFGAGLNDPNFEYIRRWTRETIPTLAVKHYRLCLESELMALREEHSDESIEPVSFGADYRDLIDFLQGLHVERKELVVFRPEDALESLESGVRGQSVILSHAPTNKVLPVREMLIPPVLLPMPQEQYVTEAKRNRGLGRPTRCDLREELQARRVLIVGDPNSGVSSALAWFIAQWHEEDPNRIPISVDGRMFGARKQPLEHEIRKQLRIIGYGINDSAALPTLALSVDNLHQVPSRVLERVAAEVFRLDLARVVVGCRTMSEMDLQAAFKQASVPLHQRHVGRLNQSDVRALAALADEQRAGSLAEKAIEMVKAQHLPTTPFTFAMIISALLRGEALLSARSQTTLLDAYVTLLMGWGRVDDDSRFGMDARNRSDIVGRLAELYVRRAVGSLPQEAVIAELAKTFEELEWPDVPINVLKDLEHRRLFLIRGTEVAFAQSSYLHLFAAKRAGRSPDFRDYLRSNPLFFSPILQHYAALERDDEDLLRLVLGVLPPFDDEFATEQGLFSSSDAVEVPYESAVVAEQQATLLAAAEPDENHDDLDGRPDRDVEPFPLDPIDEVRGIPRMVIVLTLVSSVIRDTEIVTDRTLRRYALSKVLIAWAKFSQTLDSEPGFSSFTDYVLSELVNELHISEKRSTRLAIEFREGLALGIAAGGIAATLSTRKLAVALNACMDSDDFMAHSGRAAMAALLALEIQLDDWPSRFAQVAQLHGGVSSVDQLLRGLARSALIRQGLSGAQETDLVNFLTDRALEKATGTHDRERMRLTVEKSILAARMTRTRPILSAGETILSDTQLE